METNEAADGLLGAVREAIDVEELEDVVEELYGHGCDEQVAVALREVAAEEAARAALGASNRARRRGRPVQGEDVGEWIERRRECCENEVPPTFFKFGVWEPE